MCVCEHARRMRGGSGVWPQIKMQDKGPSSRKGDQQSGDAGNLPPIRETRDTAKITLTLKEQRKVSAICSMHVHQRDYNVRRAGAAIYFLKVLRTFK